MISRRDFLKQASVAAGVAAAAGRLSWCAVPASALSAARQRGKAVTLLHDAGFTGDGWGWQFTSGAGIDRSTRHRGSGVLRIRSQDTEYARFLVLSPRTGAKYTLSGWVKTENIRSHESGGGAFFVASQFEFQGRPALHTSEGFGIREIRYGNWTGSHDWQPFHQTFTCLGDTEWFEIAAGVASADGSAWFSAMTFVEGLEPAELENTMEPAEAIAWAHRDLLRGLGRERPSAAILREPDLPVRGAASDPELLAEMLRPHYDCVFLSAAEIADAGRLNRNHFDLLVLPYGETFPAAAHQNLLTFLENGGDFFSTGGYAFESPVIKVDGHWRLSEGVAAETSTENLAPPFPESSASTKTPWKASNPHACSASEGMLRVALPAGSWGQSAEWSSELDARGEAELYWIEGEVAAGQVSGIQGGYGYFYLDQLDDTGQIIFGATAELAHDLDSAAYRSVQKLVPLTPRTRKLRIRFGLANATGTISLRNVRLEHRGKQVRINTANGFPQDLLIVRPDQIGVFDASYRLERAQQLVAAPDQPWLPAFTPMQGQFTGYAASGVLGLDNARWIPLVHALDGLGRLRGSAGALVHHYHGTFARSSWLFFGVANIDLFPSGKASLRNPVQQTLGKMARKCFLSATESEFTCYRQGEYPRIRVTVHNFGLHRQDVRVGAVIASADGQQQHFSQTSSLQLDAGDSQSVVFEWKTKQLPDGPLHVTTKLHRGDELIDTHLTAFEVWNPEALKQPASAAYADNHYRFDERNVFLQGTDDYLHTFLCRQESPLTWRRDAMGCRDNCIDIYENLMGLRGPQQKPPETWWRWIDAMALGLARSGARFLPGLLIFSNTAVESKDLDLQTAFAREFAERYNQASGLMYYLNGDLELHNPNLPELQALYHDYLRKKYGTQKALRSAWSLSPPEMAMDQLPIQTGTDAWADVRTFDNFVFREQLVTRWLDSIDSSIRKTGSRLPIMSEIYPYSDDGVDLISGTDSLTYATFGYFNVKDRDREQFPQTLKLLNLGLLGKGSNVGEFGVITHPAWSQYSQYQSTRSARYQQAYFLALTHYAFGLGAALVQNWCWKYPTDLVFEWGITYPCDDVPVDVRMYYRNSGLLFRRFRPSSSTSQNLFLIPGNNRKGGGGAKVHAGLLNAVRLLIDSHASFVTLGDEAIDRMPSGIQRILYPLPYCPDDAIVEKLAAWVRQGGVLYLSGDISYDPLRQRTRGERLRKLCGVRFVRELYPNIGFSRVSTPVNAANGSGWPSFTGAPGISIETEGASVLAQTATGPVVTEFALGAGRVIFSTDPIEMHAPALHSPDGHAFYQALLSRMGIGTQPLTPADAPVHLFSPESQDGTRLFVAINISGEPQKDLRIPVQLSIPPWRTGFAAIAKDGSVQAVEGFGSIRNGDTPLLTSSAHVIALSADRQSIESSRRVLLLPMGEGAIRLPNASRWRQPVLLVGAVEGGRWRTHARRKPQRDGSNLLIPVDADTNLSMLVVAEASDESAVAHLMEQWVLEPWALEEALG